MYTYQQPKPIEINLCDSEGFQLRQKAAKYVEENLNITGAERGSQEQQGFGALAEIVIRNKLGMQEVNPENHPVGYDILLPSRVKADVKCRGGKQAFKEEYENEDGFSREAKHNFFARQLFNDSLDTDIYIMTHLQTSGKGVLPGSTRERNWKIYVCGWVSKKRVIREGVFLPRGSLTERGRTWFTYRGQEIEFYNKNLNGLTEIEDLQSIESQDVSNDENHIGDLNITSVDAVRIAYDLKGRGISTQGQVDYVIEKTGVTAKVKPILHPNQYFHLLRWLAKEGKCDNRLIEKAREIMVEEEFSEI